MNFQLNKPYNDLPLLPPESEKFETVKVYKKLSEARASLAELKGRMPVIPKPEMLINTLVLQEARDSSIIENINTEADILFTAFTSNKQNFPAATKEVLRYRQALWQAFQSPKQWKLDWIVKIFQTITLKQEAVRDAQVRIGNDFSTVYTPPQPGKILKEKLSNFIKFAQNNSVDPLIAMVILHYQFESIHPFSDGNGRTGRILNVLYLTKKGLLDLPILYISKYILEYKSEYYRLLRDVTENGNWESWILFILEAVNQTSKFTLEKINAIYNYFNEVVKQVKDKAKDIYSYELIELIFSQPYSKIGLLVESKIASRNTASKYLNKLHEIGILEPKKIGNEILYLNKKLYEILSAG
ncbi:MAG: Fic family protein [Candidatus Marinimicrobia bacterium]|nr:Fic family protein [Candidatus Neomarinimicrobiota bacterium]